MNARRGNYRRKCLIHLTIMNFQTNVLQNKRLGRTIWKLTMRSEEACAQLAEGVEWISLILDFFFLWLYSPIQALAASMKLSVSFQLLDLGQSVGLLGRVISSSRDLSTCTLTQQNAHTTQTINIRAQSGIRTHGLGVRASENSSCRTPLSYRDRQY
jgi:hypothetical protein